MSHQTPLTANPVPMTANVVRVPSDDFAAHWFGWFWFVSSQIWPRVFILAFWIFGQDWMPDAFDHKWVIPVVGFFVAPYTIMTYALMWGLSQDGVSGWEWIVVGFAALLDIVTWAEGRRLMRG
jgi:hypothetical protein